MSEPKSKLESSLPDAITRPAGWRSVVVWVVPVVAAIIAGYLVFDRLREVGPEITVRFKDGSGIRIGQTPVKYRGVPIGEVTGAELSQDLQHVAVSVRLRRSADAIAREGSTFWIVRPEVGPASITGLSTVITGPEIQVIPGNGDTKKEFDGLERAPAALDEKGLKVVLRGPRLGSLSRGSPVYYHGVEVGVVQETDLSDNASAVEVQVLIRERYAPLVRTGTVFWNVSGVSVSGGIFKGVQFKMESMKSLAAGGIAFATPSGELPRAKEGSVYALNEGPPKESGKWAPRIKLTPSE